MKNVTNDFQLFMEESNGVGPALMNSVMKLSETSALEPKTQELAYISVLAVLKMTSGLPFHVKHAKELGATLEEIKSAVLVGLPMLGLQLSESFAIAIQSYVTEFDPTIISN